MCDYSLHATATRPAVIGDKLVTTVFPNSFSRGLAAIDDPRVAVCLRPGTELAFEHEVEFEHFLRRLLPRSRFGMTDACVARFRQINRDRDDVHHDAVEFPDGRIVLLTRLLPGQRATVLQLPASDQGEAQSVREPGDRLMPAR